MAAKGFAARHGLCSIAAGVAATLALAVGTLQDAANRIGFYADTTAAAEKLVMVVGGIGGPEFTRSAAVVNVAVNGTLTLSGLTSGRVPYISTGGLIVNSASFQWDNANQQLLAGDGTGTAGFAVNGAVSTRFIDYQSAGVLRWRFRVDNTAESGANAGSNWGIQAYTDAGATIDVPLSIARVAGGSITIVRPFSQTGATSFSTGTGSVSLNGAVTAASTLQVGAQVTVSFNNATMVLGNGVGTASFFIDGAAGSAKQFFFRTNGVSRWLYECQNTAESGADAGSDFALRARTDAGAAIDNPLVITRAAGGSITMARPVVLSTASAGLTLSKTSGTTLTIASTDASTSTGTGSVLMAGGLGVAGAIFGRTLAANASLDGQITVTATNTNAGTSALGLFQAENNSSVFAQVISFGSAHSSVAYGIARANWAQVQAVGAACNGLLIACRLIDKPIVFGINDSEVARFDTTGNFQLSDAKNIIFNATTGSKIGTATTQKIGFWNATPVAQQTVTGSRAGGAALTDLLTKLATAGLIVDGTSA